MFPIKDFCQVWLPILILDLCPESRLVKVRVGVTQPQSLKNIKPL